MSISSDKLLRGVKRRITLPANQVLLDNDNILEMADDVISGTIIPLIKSVNHDFFVYEEQEALVAGQSLYDIPYRAIGRGLRDLKIKDPSNNVRSVPLIALEDIQYYVSNSNVSGFCFQSDKIRLVPDTPSSIPQSNYLLKYYELAPNKLIQTSNACLVTAVSAPGLATTDVTVAAVPSVIVVNADIDFIQSKSGSTILGMDVDIQGINGTTLTFLNADVPSGLIAGDYIALAGYSPVLNFIPNELYSYIETRLAMRILSAIGDYEGLAILKGEVSEDKTEVKQMLAPRIEGEPILIVNRTGLVRGSKIGQNWLYGVR